MLDRTYRALGPIAAAIALSVAFLAPGVWAQDAPVRVRGTIERVDGATYFVKTRDGSEVQLKLAPQARVTAIVEATLADVKQGTYIGVAALPLADGSQKALEIHVFPEAMRGVGDGHRGWDLQASSTMTNGNIESATASADGQVLTLKYKDGEKKIVVPPGIPIVAFTPADVSELKAGAKIFVVAAKKLPDGTLETTGINVGKGATPPM
jgi:hypothetical protein